MQQGIHDTNMSYITTRTIVIDISVYIDWSLGTLFGTTTNHPLCGYKDKRNSEPLPYLDGDGGSTATSWLSRLF